MSSRQAPAGFDRLYRLQARTSRTLAHHGRDVGSLAALACPAAGIPDRERLTILRAGLLHDIGKLLIDRRILEKPSSLEEAEFEQVKRHVRISELALAKAALTDEAVLVAGHHERPDGRGYPAGTKGAAISRGALLLSAADGFCSMLEARPYSRPLTLPQAAAELEAGAGTQFGAQSVRAVLATASAGLAGPGPPRKALAAILRSPERRP